MDHVSGGNYKSEVFTLEDGMHLELFFKQM